MTFNNDTYEITMSQYDFGVPIMLDAGAEEGFHDGETVVFCFQNDRLDDKPCAIHLDEEGKCKITLVFDKEEMDGLFDDQIPTFRNIKYSVKRYKGTEFLESLENSNNESIFNLKVKGTVKYDGEISSTQSTEG